MATAAVIKLLLDWLLPLGLVYARALLPPHMRYRRISEPTREVFRIPLPGSQWAQHASGSTEAPAGGAATSRGAAEPAPPPIKRLRGKVPPPPPLLPPKIPEDRPLSPTPSLHPDEQDDGKDPSSGPPPSSPTDMPEASQLPSPTTPAKSAEFGVEGADQTPEGWEAHPESGYGSTSTSGCWSGGDGPGDSGWKPPLPSDPPLPFPPGATTFGLPNGDRVILPPESAADFCNMVGAPAGANAAERIQEHITKTWEEVTGATAAPSAASGTAISATEAVLEMSTPGPQGEEDQEKDEEEEPEADYDRDLSPEPESRAGETRAGETSHGTPDIDMEPLPGGGRRRHSRSQSKRDPPQQSAS